MLPNAQMCGGPITLRATFYDTLYDGSLDSTIKALQLSVTKRVIAAANVSYQKQMS